MALDYKTLQAMSAGQPEDTERYCPECGRPVGGSPAERAEHPPPFAWRSAFLGVVGLFLVITFGVRVWSAYPMVSRDSISLWEAQDCLAQSAGQPRCVQVFSDTARELRRDLLLTTVGTAAVVVRLGALVRRPLRTRPDRHGRAILMVLWGMAEALLAGVCLLILALFVDLVAVQLALGRPPTREMLERAADGSLAILSIVAGV